MAWVMYSTVLSMITSILDVRRDVGRNYVKFLIPRPRYRALAIDVITIKHQNIVRPLSVDFRGLITSVWQKSGRFYSDLRNASTLELTLLVCHSSL